jgi:hypothetical protein
MPWDYVMKTKICSKCRIEKDIYNFGKDKTRKDGLYPYCKECRKLHNQKNKIKIAKYTKNYQINHKDIRNKYRRKKFKIDYNYKILENLRGRIYKALKNNSKSKRTIDLLGCTIEELKIHLESQFTDGMSWDNYGDWHIDHKTPCASFDLSKPEEQYKCFNFKNLQPLWAKENLRKGSKLVTI